MKKIPTLFERVFENRRIVDIKDIITPGCEEAFKYGTATVKYDGSCCAFINGVFYKRYDAKKGKTPPEGAIPCCDPDPITGHWPHWVPVNGDDPADKWFIEALKHHGVENILRTPYTVTYEAVGKHFNGNPYGLEHDTLMKHGTVIVSVERDFDSIKNWLETTNAEGLVFWFDNEPVCKIKRTDFGLPWPVK